MLQSFEFLDLPLMHCFCFWQRGICACVHLCVRQCYRALEELWKPYHPASSHQSFIKTGSTLVFPQKTALCNIYSDDIWIIIILSPSPKVQIWVYSTTSGKQRYTLCSFSLFHGLLSSYFSGVQICPCFCLLQE